MPSPPYDTVINVINEAKVRLGDKIDTLAAIGGSILDNTQPFTQQLVNNAWRKMQEYLAELGYSGLKQETVFVNVPACTSADTTVQVYLNYAGFFDGTTLQSAPVLPQDFIRPYDLWERIYTGGANTNPMLEMDYILNGLPSIPKMAWNRQWEWRDDTLYMPGATGATDIRIRYAGLLADFIDISSAPGPNQVVGPWFTQPVPIMRCLDSLADYCCREIEISRGSAEAAIAFEASGRMNAQLILNRDSAQPKSILKASEYGKMQDRFTPNNGANTQPINRAGTGQTR